MTGLAAMTASDMGGFPCQGPGNFALIEVTPDQAEFETNRKPAQSESEYIHLGVGGAGDEKKTEDAEYGHHQSDNEVTYAAVHLHLSRAARRTRCGDAETLTLIHIKVALRPSGYVLRMLEMLWGLCTSETALQGGLLAGLFVAGAAGSVVHCGPMCGIFVLGQMSERMARLPAQRMCERQRIGNGLLLPYHLGRLTTYAGLGALAAGSAAVFGQVTWFRQVSAVLLLIAAGLFLVHAFQRVGRFDWAPRFWGRSIGALTRRIPRGTPLGEYGLGLALGFLPCGFLYAALAAAAGSARPDMGAAGMLAFGLGTTPVLMIIGVAGHAASRRLNRWVGVAAPVLMAVNAVLLLALAWQRVM